MTRTLIFTGAKGGQGTTTVAATVAVFAAGHQPTTLVADTDEVATLLGLPRPTHNGPVSIIDRLWTAHSPVAGTTTVVVDAGTDPDPVTPDPGAPVAPGADPVIVRYLVIRGPCYLAVAAALARLGPPPDGIVLLSEEGRSLTARDVTEVTGIPMVAQVRVSDTVARAVDAGLLLARLHHLPDLRPLHDRATTTVTAPLQHPTSQHPASQHPSRIPLPPPLPPSPQPPNPQSTNGTDLPCPQCGHGGDRGGPTETRRESHPSMHVEGPWQDQQGWCEGGVEHRPARRRRRSRCATGTR